MPGALEHKILMGMPREPTIFNKINEMGVKCLDVNINPGGCSWASEAHPVLPHEASRPRRVNLTKASEGPAPYVISDSLTRIRFWHIIRISRTILNRQHATKDSGLRRLTSGIGPPSLASKSYAGTG